jgi:hypothetical protein
MKSLVLITDRHVHRVGKEDDLLSSFDGPTALVAAVTKLLQTMTSMKVHGWIASEGLV